MKHVTILIPTKDRPVALAATLTSLLFQTYQNFYIVISDQGNLYTISNLPTFKTLQRIFKEKGILLSFFKHLPKKGMAEQRDFLLKKSSSPYSLFLDDDIVLENFVIHTLVNVIEEEQCGFVGQAVIGLSYLYDVRPHEEYVEFWEDRVKPEKILPHDEKWMRYTLHNAANIYHTQKRMEATPHNPLRYKVAWIGGCVLYDTGKLKKAGGFGFWKDLPKNHAGEDVLAQLHVMERYGGCGILPSGAYHQELPTTIVERNINAPEYENEQQL